MPEVPTGATPARAASAEFVGLTGGGGSPWRLDVDPGVCSGYGTLFGGVALGAAIAAVEDATGRPLVWATGQFVTNAVPGEQVTFDVDVTQRGGRTSQARIRGHVSGREVISVFSACGDPGLGDTALPESGRWVDPPDVGDPGECPPRSIPHLGPTIASRFEQRLALGRATPEDPPLTSGRAAMWSRTPPGVPLDAVMLAVLGDFVPFGTAQNLGTPVTGVSLDNTLRVVSAPPSPGLAKPGGEWCLLDIRIDAVAHGYAHGHVYLWSEDRSLLATATQTAQLRSRPGA